MEEPIVRIEHLSHRYNVQWSIRDISLEIPNKGVYGLLGSNGAGKSTVMNILCGVINPTEGEVFIQGIDARSNPVSAKRHIGFLPQKPPLFNDLTVEEYLIHAANIRLLQNDEVHSAVEEVMNTCKITHFRNRLIKNLSGGYQQRVGIAQAIVHKPELVVLDEPTNGLDPNQIIDIRGIIKDIAEERTVIISTHILTEVQATCENIIMLEEGKIVFSGTIEDFDNYIVPDSIIVSMTDAPSIDVLNSLNGVSSVESLGHNEFRIRFTDAGEVMDKLVESAYRNKWHIREMRVEKSSLDDIFSVLSKKDKNN